VPTCGVIADKVIFYSVHSFLSVIVIWTSER